MAFNHWDIGGYTTLDQFSVVRTKELLLRWMEASAFTAVYRTHEGNQPRSNAQFYSDDESLDAFSRFAKVYTALGSYRAGVFTDAAEHGWPVVRHPWLNFPDDGELLRLAPNELEMMLGSDVLVAPVLEPGVTKRRVYFPKGKWVHLFRAEVLGSDEAGGYVDVEAPMGTPAAFVRQGSPAEATIKAAFAAAGF
jgi:alpha-glucosidase